MIDWWSLIRHALWIVGAAMILWSWSYHHWLASMTGAPRREIFARSEWRITSSVGLVLICVSQATLAPHWWSAAAWMVLAIGSGRRFRHSLREAIA